MITVEMKSESAAAVDQSIDSETGSSRTDASFLRRAFALAVDLIPPVVVSAAAIAIAEVVDSPICKVLAWIVVICATIFVGWNSVVCQGRSGTTVGKKLVRLRLVSEIDHTPLGIPRAGARFACHLVDTVPLLIGWLWPLWDSKRQTLSDKFVRSVVIADDAESAATFRPGVRYLLVPVLPIIAVLALVAIQFFGQRADDRQLTQSHDTVSKVASDGAAAILSYRPETVDQDLASAESRLTGDFLDTYTKLAKDVVGPTAKEKKVTMQATPVGAAVESVSKDQASVLVYINQITTVADNPTPTQSQNAVRVSLTRIDGDWLIDRFDPLF